MSIPVDVTALAAEIEGRSFCYLLTVSADGRPKAVAVSPTFDGVFTIEAGPGTRSNAVDRPAVVMVWPPAVGGGFSLIVDGEASVDGDHMLVSPTGAVLHRPAPVN